MHRKTRRWVGSIVTLAAAALLITPAMGAAHPNHRARTVVDVEFIGEAVVPTGTTFEGTEIGGLSSITYDRWQGVYRTLSDDQGNRPTGDPVRYYTVALDLSDGTFDDGDVEFIDVQQLFEKNRRPFEPAGLDPEGFAFGRDGTIYMSSEGNTLADPIIDPFIRQYGRNGRLIARLPVPNHYIPNRVDRGVRFNLSFESLNPTPNRRFMLTAGEGALFQDGPASTFDNSSLARILKYDLLAHRPVAEYVYEVGPWAEPSTIFGVNGIVELLPIDNVGTMLVMERSFSVGGVLGGGTANVVVIKEVSTQGATDVLRTDTLYDGGAPIDLTPVSSDVIFAFDDLGIPIDNLEGMTFGPRLPDGRRSLVIVSDNNFNTGQFTQFILLALDIESVDH